ncbi:MAG TPA: chromosomal replication initiator protein DnaA [Candidatus Tripitaka californicus]
MVQDIGTIWPKVLDELKNRVTEQQFKTWFSHLEPEGLQGAKVELRVPGPIYKDWLAHRYKPLLEEVFSSVSQEPVRIAFTLSSDPPASSLGISGGAEKATPVPLQVYLNKRYTFENFVADHSNRLAHAAALSVVSSPGYTYNPLFIYGGPGTGKSHLLQAIYFALLSKGAKVLYIPCDGFVSHFVFALRNQQVERFRKAYRELDALLLDNVEQLANSPASREELFHTFNALFNNQRQLVFAAGCSPDSLPGVEARLVSRFSWGLLARLEPADTETRAAIVGRMALFLDLPLSKEAALFLAENTSSNIKELERILGFLSSLYPSGHPPLSLPEVKEPLLGLLPTKGHTVHIEEILRTVATFFRIPRVQLQSKSRTRTVSLPRQVAMYLARRFTSLSLQEVGGYLGGRDHSTVVHAEKRILALKASRPDVDSLISQIETLLQGRC